MSRQYIMLYYDFLEGVDALDMAERGRLVTALLEYARGGGSPGSTLVGNERFLFPVYRMQLDRDAEAYENRCRQNAANGAKGGRPPKGKKQTVISETENSQYKDEEEEDEKEKEKEEKKDKQKDGGASPCAPSLDEVLTVCRSENLKVDANTFWNYYQANGWQAGGHPIRDWRAKLREWNRRDESGDTPRGRPAPEPINPALNYEQREYREEDFGEDFFFDLSEYGLEK